MSTEERHAPEVERDVELIRDTLRLFTDDNHPAFRALARLALPMDAVFGERMTADSDGRLYVQRRAEPSLMERLAALHGTPAPALLDRERAESAVRSMIESAYRHGYGKGASDAEAGVFDAPKAVWAYMNNLPAWIARQLRALTGEVAAPVVTKEAFDAAMRAFHHSPRHDDGAAPLDTLETDTTLIAEILFAVEQCEAWPVSPNRILAALARRQEQPQEGALQRIAGIIPHQHCQSCNQMAQIARAALHSKEAPALLDRERLTRGEEETLGRVARVFLPGSDARALLDKLVRALTGEVAAPLDTREQPQEGERCEVCGWTLAASRTEGCVPGDCSYRPAEGTDEYRRIQARRAALHSTPVLPLNDAERGGGWPEGISDGLTLACGRCGVVPRFDYHVSDDLWGRVVPPAMRLGVVCLPCLDALAVAVGEDAATCLEQVQWTGIGKTVVLRPVLAQHYTPRPASAPPAAPLDTRETDTTLDGEVRE